MIRIHDSAAVPTRLAISSLDKFNRRNPSESSPKLCLKCNKAVVIRCLNVLWDMLMITLSASFKSLAICSNSSNAKSGFLFKITLILVFGIKQTFESSNAVALILANSLEKTEVWPKIFPLATNFKICSLPLARESTGS